MRKTISIILVLVMLFAFVGCGGVEHKPAPGELPEMGFEETKGYTVTGNVVDQSSNPIPNAVIIIEKKARGMTNEKGEFRVTALEGNNIISVDFNGYKFFNNDIVVSKETKLEFKGTNNYSISAQASIDNNPVYGVKFYVGTREELTDEDGILRLTNLTGKATITPKHENYDFFPASYDVYYGVREPIKFNAVPKGTTYAVSGFINVDSASEDFVMPNLTVLVDGAKAANVYKESKYDYVTEKTTNVYKYTVYGLDPNNKKGYVLSLVDSEWNYIKETITVTKPVKNANFNYKMSKNFYFDQILKLPNKDEVAKEHLTNAVWSAVIVDDKNVDVGSLNGKGAVIGAITAWAGCSIDIKITIEIGGKKYYGSIRTGIIDRMMIMTDNHFKLYIDLVEV